ncbi:MAG: MATE family efflux transporter [Planctomycetaceae bacterium]|jgi:putative MATE family efflux protein|nr:MATE family efflux transporter [Planctomycetaceae bacterium]
MEHTSETRQLEFAPIGRLLFRLSMPAIFASLVGATYNIVDRVFVGWKFGSDGIAAVTLTFPIMIILMAMTMLIGLGSNALVSIKIGEKNKDEAERILGQALFLFMVATMLYMAVTLFFMHPMLRLFGADEVLIPMAEEFLSIIVWGSIFHTISFGVNNFLRGEGKTQIAMWTIFISAILNIFLDWFFLFVLETGIWGLAAATVLAQAVSAVWVVWYYLSGRALLRWRLRYFCLHPKLTITVLKLGLPPFVMQTGSCFLQGIQNHQLSYYGNLYGLANGLEEGAGGRIAIAVMGILFSVFTIALFPMIGIGQGLQPIVGYNTGAKKFHRVRKSLTTALISGVAFAFFIQITVLFFPHLYVIPFLNPESPDYAMLLKLGSHAVSIFALLIPCMAVIVISSGYFQAIGHAMLALILTMLRQLFLMIPFFYVLPLFVAWLNVGVPLDGLWISHPLSDLGAFVLVIVLLINEYKRLRKLEKQGGSATVTNKIPETLPIDPALVP